MLLYLPTFAQVNDYSYKREITGINDTWHKLVLPDDVFGKLHPGLTDIRIYGFTEKGDTIEAPYLLQHAAEKITRKDVEFKLLNQSGKKDGFYYTFEVPVASAVNEVYLDFEESNFDWKVRLEGSQDQQDWYTVVQHYRILSIQGELMHYQFTKVAFSDTKYKYFRLFVPGSEQPKLISATLSLNEKTGGNYKTYTQQSQTITEDKQNKQTLIDITLAQPVPVAKLNITASDKFDFYRQITIQYVSDSTKTAQGWRYNYTTLANGMFSSIEKGEYSFASTTLKKLRIIIENEDNPSLKIQGVTLQGYEHALVARFTEPAHYYLVYGNNHAGHPSYDINRFTDKIPDTLAALQLGPEQVIEKATVANNENKTEPLFKNKLWLWGIMIVIIAALGGFTLSMMRKR